MAFRLTAAADDKAAVAKIKADAIERANVLNGVVADADATDELFRKYFAWQSDLPADSEDRKGANTLKENRYEAKRILKTFGKVKPAQIRAVHIYMDEGDAHITNATGHTSERMVQQVYDRRKTKAARATE